MPNEKSERILAALSRAKASRLAESSPTLEPGEEPRTAPPALADFSEDAESVAEEDESVASEPSLEDLLEAEEPALEEAEEVETILPLAAATDEERVSLPPLRTSITKREDFILDRRKDEPKAERKAETKSDARSESKRDDIFTFEPVSTSRKLPIKLFVTGGIVVVVGLALFLLKDQLWTSKPNAGAAPAPTLQMQVESQGSGIINIRWNAESAAVAQAREGRLLVIEQGQQPRTVSLGPEQLKIGHLYYQSPVDSVEFRLEIVDRSGAVTKDSVLALSSAKSAEPPAGPPIAPTKADSSQEQARATPTAAPAAQTKPEAKADVKHEAAVINKPAPVPQPKPAVTRSFTPPPAQRKAEEPRALIVDAPPSVPTGLASVPSVNLPDATARIAAPPAPAPPQQPLKSGGVLQAPKLVKRVSPDYPAAARSANVQGVVRFTATIAKDGTLQNVQAVSGPAVLIPAATQAVKKWIYQPMLLDGNPVEVVTQIEVNFSLRGQ